MGPRLNDLRNPKDRRVSMETLQFTLECWPRMSIPSRDEPGPAPQKQGYMEHIQFGGSFGLVLVHTGSWSIGISGKVTIATMKKRGQTHTTILMILIVAMETIRMGISGNPNEVAT